MLWAWELLEQILATLPSFRSCIIRMVSLRSRYFRRYLGYDKFLNFVHFLYQGRNFIPPLLLCPEWTLLRLNTKCSIYLAQNGYMRSWVVRILVQWCFPCIFCVLYALSRTCVCFGQALPTFTVLYPVGFLDVLSNIPGLKWVPFISCWLILPVCQWLIIVLYEMMDGEHFRAILLYNYDLHIIYGVIFIFWFCSTW